MDYILIYIPWKVFVKIYQNINWFSSFKMDIVVPYSTQLKYLSAYNCINLLSIPINCIIIITHIFMYSYNSRMPTISQ